MAALDSLPLLLDSFFKTGMYTIAYLQCLKVTRKYEFLLDLALLKVYPAKFDQVSNYMLSRASIVVIYKSTR